MAVIGLGTFFLVNLLFWAAVFYKAGNKCEELYRRPSAEWAQCVGVILSTIRGVDKSH